MFLHRVISFKNYDPIPIIFKQIGWKVDLRVMAMKVSTTLTRALKLEPHHLMKFSVIPRALLSGGEVLSICRGHNQHILNEYVWEYGVGGLI